MDKLMTKKAVCAMIGYSPQHIARLEKAKKFPQRLKPMGLPNSKAFWLERDIQAWIHSHISDRST